MSDQVVGRDEDLRAASAFLQAVATGPAGLVFAGEPGIAKTTLWTTKACLFAHNLLGDGDGQRRRIPRRLTSRPAAGRPGRHVREVGMVMA